MKHYRTEWKYQSDRTGFGALRERMLGVMEHDPHASERGLYSINSLYFDDHKNRCSWENVEGEGIRFKYRIRYYGDYTGKLFLEKKEKINSYCHKRSVQISEEQFFQLVEGDVADLLWDESNGNLLRDFAMDIITNDFSPKVIISYDREAFVEPISNVRITFDQSISASNEFDRFLAGDFVKVPVLDGSRQILEVKFDEVLPSYIRLAIEGKALTQQSFSKYYMGRMKIQEYLGL